jgi:hypothetical protein
MKTGNPSSLFTDPASIVDLLQGWERLDEQADEAGAILPFGQNAARNREFLAPDRFS